MVNIVQDELFTVPTMPCLIVVTTNATVKNNGALVMGRGAALWARDNIPHIDVECGILIDKHYDYYQSNHYGFGVVRDPRREGKVGFGIFQVKNRYYEKADTNLIEYSVECLRRYAEQNADIHIRMNFPGIGNGKLSRELVEPMLEMLPDNVFVCYR